jgi:hypothetical protein
VLIVSKTSGIKSLITAYLKAGNFTRLGAVLDYLAKLLEKSIGDKKALQACWCHFTAACTHLCGLSKSKNPCGPV